MARNLGDKTIKILKNLNIINLTEVQEKCLVEYPRNDIIIQSPTGTGKTLAFILPIIEKVSITSKALIIAPTRELAIQIKNVASNFQKCSLFIGGTEDLSDENPIIVSTPGRLLHNIVTKKEIFKKVKFLILDEADKLLGMGFKNTILSVVKQLPKTKNALISATMDSIEDISKIVLRNPVKIQSDQNIFLDLRYVVCDPWNKLEFIFSLKGRSVVFFATCAEVNFFYSLMLKNENTKNENLKNENLKNENTKNENLKNENIKNENLKNENIKNENIKNENTKNENIKNENTKNENIKNENIKNENTKNENTKNENTKNENLKNENIKNENTKNGVYKIDLTDDLKVTDFKDNFEGDKNDINLKYKNSESNDMSIITSKDDVEITEKNLGREKADDNEKYLILKLHSKMTQTERNEIYKKIESKENFILLCTDIAARGLDFVIDKVIHFDIPLEPLNLTHRSGRTARNGQKGEAILLIMKNELPYLKYLEQKGMKAVHCDYTFKEKDYFNLTVDSQLAVKAFVAYIRSYKEHLLSFIFRYQELDFDSLAKLYFLEKIPVMDELRNIKFKNFTKPKSKNKEEARKISIKRSKMRKNIKISKIMRSSKLKKK
ncbi:ATP-dependent rRNA helicase SPB4 [Dictyocoela muelleri]|nr:ATP-dependent rRNA helicase SPB4 [Dictyocoela muelleri]